MDGKTLQKELDIVPCVSDKQISVGSEQRNLRCPCCGDEYNHIGAPYMKDGGDNYEAKWHGRGDLNVIPMSGECGSEWELCVGFHKGEAPIFVRVIKDCRNKST